MTKYILSEVWQRTVVELNSRTSGKINLVSCHY